MGVPKLAAEVATSPLCNHIVALLLGHLARTEAGQDLIRRAQVAAAKMRPDLAQDFDDDDGEDDSWKGNISATGKRRSA